MTTTFLSYEVEKGPIMVPATRSKSCLAPVSPLVFGTAGALVRKTGGSVSRAKLTEPLAQPPTTSGARHCHVTKWQHCLPLLAFCIIPSAPPTPCGWPPAVVIGWARRRKRRLCTPEWWNSGPASAPRPACALPPAGAEPEQPFKTTRLVGVRNIPPKNCGRAEF
eukprot:1195957-Prorocentrum_minimum.AAC.2